MTKISNQYSLTNILTADLTNSRLGVNNTNPSYSLDLTGDARVGGSLIVTGNLTAQQFIVSSSVTYLTESFASGSHKFGDSSDDNHNFTGSLIVSGSANPLRVGSNLLFVSSSGNVGIGTSSPNTLLTTNQTGTTGYFYSGQQSGTEIAYWYYNANEIQFSSKAVARALTFLTNDTERMRITSGGNVQIGSTLSNSLSVGLTAPTTDTLNHIFAGQGVIAGQAAGGETDIGNNWYYYSGWKYRVAAATSNIKLNGDVISFERAASGTANAAITFLESMRITSGGVVNIGKTDQSGNAVLTVKSPAGGNTGVILIEGDTTNDGWGMYATTADEYRITRFTNGSYSDKVIIASSGAVTVNNILTSTRLYTSTAYFGFFPNHTGAFTWEIGSDSSYPGMYFYNNPNGYVFRLTAAGAATFVGGVTSDRRVKENIKYITSNALSFMNELKPCSYEFIGDNNDKTRRGFIAQEVLETSIPDLVLGDGEKEGGTYGLDYDGILALAVKAIQELSSANESLKNRIEVLENK
jgi:hypothetical protein